MTLFERISLLLTDPDYAMSDQYDSPAIQDAFMIVLLYAIVVSLKSFFEGAILVGSIGTGLMTFLLSFLLVFVTWILLTLFFHFVSDVMGGLGELPNAFSFVGLAAAPMLLTSSLALVVSITGRLFLEEDAIRLVSWINLTITWIGMVWGWPGVLCYFGLKHAERLSSLKAIVLTLIAFFSLAFFELFQLGLFSESL